MRAQVSLPRVRPPHGCGEASDTSTPLFALARVSVMHLPNHPTLQKLNTLDKSLSEFHDQLSNVLYGEEYARCMKDLRDDELVWLIDFLDDVCSVLSLLAPRLTWRRPLMVSPLLVPLSERLYANSAVCAGPG